MHCIFYSKIETGLSSKDDGDVAINAYLEKLLSLFTDPRGFDLEEVKRQLIKIEYDSEVFSRLARADDGMVKYQIYRTKTDFLLVSVAMIDNSREPVPKHRPPFYENISIGTRSDYLCFDYIFAKTMNKGDFPITDLLEKLSLALDEKYPELVYNFRGERHKGKPDLFQRLTKGKFYHLEVVIDEAGRREALEEKYDQLLELISRRKRRKSSQVEKDQVDRELQALVEEIKGLKPEFSFSLPEKLGR